MECNNLDICICTVNLKLSTLQSGGAMMMFNKKVRCETVKLSHYASHSHSNPYINIAHIIFCYKHLNDHDQTLIYILYHFRYRKVDG